MASSSVQGITSSSSSSPPLYMYDAFLSFRGKDTRNNFTSHLYSNLVQRGIDVYMDDRELERGKSIEPALWKAIEESRFSVIIFSRDYASSPWCLDELVKIVQCMKEMGHTVLPVFYDVDPSEVAEQKGQYEKAFVEHEQNFTENLEKVRNWKDCLSTVANLSGWDVRNRNESESIKIIVEYIFYKLSVTLPTISKKLVGIDSCLEVLNGYIGKETGEAIFIGICGMGGIGKTTLARVLYDRIRWQFEGNYFLANVKEVFAEKDGRRRLQEQLLSEILMERANIWDSYRGIEMIKRRLRHKKILLILDDVDDKEQLEFLAEEPGWFGPGSKIIITSRDTNVLTRNDDTKIYEAEKLNDDDALMLFSQKAFKNDQPAEDFMELSKQVVGYANGLPLALEVIGSFLYARSIPEWRGAINRMNEIPDGKIIDVLRISFDGLHESDKKIFLDIACFLKGFKIDRITRILESRGFHAGIGIPVLIERSLISVSRDQVWMHNLLQIMGKEIVRCESLEEPGRRSRLWTYEDVCLALMDNTGKEKIEAIFLDMPGIREARWNMEAFSKMSKLRLLKINNVQLSEGPEDLSNKLRFLEWHSYPLKSLPTGLQVDELVELHMANSRIEQLWYGSKSAVNLKIINLSNSLNLIKTPDLTGIPNLESLILEGCQSLSEVHPSLAHHKKLQYVNLMDCESIRILPCNLEMESLKVCILDGCSKLEKFPDIVGNMNYLMVLRLDGTGIEQLSSSIHHLIGLEVLSMKTCKNLKIIPSSIGCLKSLKKLDLFDCSELENIPENLGKVESLEEFDVSGTSIRQPPKSIFLLKNLKVLSFDGCKRIAVSLTDQRLPSLSGLCSLKVLDLCACNLREGTIPEDIGCLSSLRSLDLSRNNFVSLPRSINQLSGLETLVLEDCRMLESLPEVPSKVQTVNLNGCIRLKEIPDPIKLSSSKRSEFICLDCWELYKHNGQDSLGLTMLERYLQSLSNPRPGFGIAVPGNEIPGWFNHQSKGSLISVQVPSWSMGFVACVAFSANGKSPSLFCHFKANGRENYPSPMCISCNSIQVLSDHIWLFYLSFDYLKEFKEWKHESFSNIELSFHSFQPGVKVKTCGVCLLYYPSFQSSAHFIVVSKEASSLYKASLSVSSSYRQWMEDFFLSFRGTDATHDFTHLNTALALRVIVPDDKELEKVMAIRSRLFEAIEESGLSIIIFARDCASLPWCFEELVKIFGFIDEMRADTVFPVSYNVEQSKIDDQTESYTIVFDKNEENSRENEEKVQRWMNILSEVEISSVSGSLKRLHLSDELVLYFLKRKICENSFKFDTIPDVDVYKWDPEELPELSALESRRWYFFGPRDRRYPTGARLKRATKQGYWKPAGRVSNIVCNSREVGVKKTLVFCRGRAPRGQRTGWKMQEYTLNEKELEGCTNVQDCYALYKLYIKKKNVTFQDHERAFFDSADWALGKQGVEKPKGPLEALRPKLQPALIFSPMDSPPAAVAPTSPSTGDASSPASPLPAAGSAVPLPLMGTQSPMVPLSNTHHVVSLKLTNTNYLYWRMQMKPYLLGQGVFQFVDGSLPCPPSHMIDASADSSSAISPSFLRWKQQDQLILSALLSSLSVDVLHLVVDCSTSHCVWRTLEKALASPSNSRIMQLHGSFQDLRQGDASVSMYMQQAKSLFDELAAAGRPMSLEDFNLYVFRGLRGEFKDLVTSLITKAEPLSYADLHSHLLTHEFLHKNSFHSMAVGSSSSSLLSSSSLPQQPPLLPTPPNSAYYAMTNHSRNRGRSRGNWRSNTNRFQAPNRGHSAADWRQN